MQQVRKERGRLDVTFVDNPVVYPAYKQVYKKETRSDS